MTTVEESQNAILGYGFEDDQTRLELELIDDLQKLGVSEYIDLPQLVVVGEQSAGKSSVLQAVTEIPFPINDNMCTRFATEIVLKRTLPGEPTRVDVSIIPDPNDSAERKTALRAWRPNGFDHSDDLSKAAIESIFSQAEAAIFDENVERKKERRAWAASTLSSATLQITRSGPKENNFAIVDIPGLIREQTPKSHSLKSFETAKALVGKYLQNPQSIVVVVLDITHPDRQEIYRMLGQISDQESRVIGVINKCDRKQAQSDAWVFDLIRNTDRSKKAWYLKEGWYGLRNRLPSELEISDEERDRREEEFFKGEDWSSLDGKKLGRHNLKSALIKMRNRHVKRSVPRLLLQIQQKLDKCVSDIEKLGEARTTNQAQFTLINRIATKYSMMSQGALNGHYDILPRDAKFYARKRIRDDLDTFQRDMVATGLKVRFRSCEKDAEIVATTQEKDWAREIMKLEGYAWIRLAIHNYRAKEDIGEINPEVKNQLWKEQTESWEKTASNTLDRIKTTIDLINTALFEEACPDVNLREKLQNWLQAEFSKAVEDAKAEMKRIVVDEREAHLFTLHPSKMEKQQSYHKDRIQAITDKYIVIHPEAGLPQVAMPPSKVNHVPAHMIINSLIYENAELVGVLNTHDSLAAYYDVALYRFIDNFALQVIERHLLGPHGPLRLFNSEYVTANLYGEGNARKLSDLASEDPNDAKNRADLEVERKSLEKGKKRVQNFKVI